MPVVKYEPNAPGDVTQLAPVGAAVNWQCVDDDPHTGNTDYVVNNVEAAAWRYDLYNFANPGLAGVINSVTIGVYLQQFQSAPPDGQGRIVAKTLAVEYRSGGWLTGGAWVLRTQVYANHPAGGAWTWAQINGLQIGVGLLNATDGKDWASPACTLVYIQIDHDLPVVGVGFKSANMGSKMVGAGII